MVTDIIVSSYGMEQPMHDGRKVMEEKYYQSISEDIRVIHNINSFNVMEFPHFHSHYELHFTLSYNLKFIIENTIFHVPKGSVVAIKPYVPHMTVVPDEAWFERYTVHIDPQILKEINCYEGFNLLGLFQSSEFPACHIKLREKDITIFEKLLDRESECLNHDFYGASVYRKLVLSELLFYLEKVKHESNSDEIQIYNDEYGILAKNIMDYITENITMDLNLDLLSEKFFINKFSLSRIFKEYCGVTVNQYIISRRIYQACELLKNNQPVFQVCEQSGFYDYGHFIRTFKKHVGISPKQYALQFRKTAEKIHKN